MFKMESPVVESDFKSCPCLNSDFSWFQISRLHFSPLHEIKVSKNLSSDCETNEAGNFSKELDLCENHFSPEFPKNSQNNLKECVFNSNSTVFEGRKLLSRSVSSLAEFKYLSGNASSFTSDCTSEKYLCDDTQSMINTRKQRNKRRIVFCCVG